MADQSTPSGREHVEEAGRDDELWSIRTVTARTGLSRSTIYDYVSRDLFPAQRQLGPRRIAWLASEVRAWIASRPQL
jgi:prophage regulatory protein